MAARAARFYNDSWEFPGYDIGKNGEGALLRALAAEDIKTIFDVGANIGEWSSESASVFPEAEVHSFEPIPSTYDSLAKRAALEPRIKPHPFGLSNSEGNAEFTFYGEENSFLSTMTAPVHVHLPSSVISARLRCGDNVTAETNTPRIDFLKIDVEGMEYEVLEGFKIALSEGRIGYIQFEKQPGRRLLKDYYSLLEANGYQIGKIYSRYVDFRPYDSLQERTAGPNYLAVPATKVALIKQLQAGFSSPKNAGV